MCIFNLNFSLFFTSPYLSLGKLHP